ncbi:fumarate hydratase C-terminal domain-containing protein [Lutispora sp.]|uniref:fumarate hydratase C-terminal domain-containing protein n=1 Tax=Lutispora sp. TaxID=2828727 RepID=UPI002B1F0217|nr:fumarate hydratase C-terminal domain-containing protein [Lutispora sp.]MEA4960791.1 fumarate hydratase C-terminal domain-containing protein [Lutispora sp.]
MQVSTPISNALVKELKVYDTLEITGVIYTGRDAVLPKIVKLIENNRLNEIGIDLNGSAVFHTAVSVAGIGPTSSNKLEIEGSIPTLSKAGVKIHIGKGSLGKNTVEALKEYNSVFAVTPPVTALLTSTIVDKRIAAFHQEGMEALHMLQVVKFPVIIAVAHGKSIFDK